MYSRRIILLIAFASSFLFLGFTFRNWIFAIFVIPVAAVGLVSSLESMPETLSFRVVRTVEPKRTVGPEDATVTIAVTNEGQSTIHNLTVEDILSPNVVVKEGTSRLQCELQAKETTYLVYRFRTERRGFYGLGPVYVRSEDLTGLRFVESTIQNSETIAAFPSIEYISNADIRPRRVGQWPGLVPARRSGVGSEFYSVRPYVAGDELRRINWKGSARSGQLITNEFEGEQVTDVAIVLDTTGSAGVFESDFIEESVSTAASLSSLLLRQGNRVGLLIHGKHRAWVPPGFGKKHLLRILYQLAGVRPGRGILTISYVLESLAPVMLPSRSQVILVSPLLEPDVAEIVKTLAAEGYSVLVLTARFDAERAGEDESQRLARRIVAVERNNILAYARRFASVVELGPGIPLSIALRRIRKWRPLLKA